MPLISASTSGKGAFLKALGQGSFVRSFESLGGREAPLVGNKLAFLGEAAHGSREWSLRVPDGFALTAEAYHHFIQESHLREKLSDLLTGITPGDLQLIQERGRQAREAVALAKIPAGLEDAILGAYEALCGGGSQLMAVAVRSSAIDASHPELDFPGQHESFLNVQGPQALLQACRSCYCSLFTNRAIAFRLAHGLDLHESSMAVGVQKMVRADLASSGAVFTRFPDGGFADALLITAAYGLGEAVVQEMTETDEYVVFKPTLQQGFKPILQKTLGAKSLKIVCDAGVGKAVKLLNVSQEECERYALPDEKILQLARWGCELEKVFGNLQGRQSSLQLEWAVDGETGELFILQVRLETGRATHDPGVETYTLKDYGPVLVSGRSVGRKIAQGPVRVIKSPAQFPEFNQGEVLVADATNPDWEPVMRKAAAIITNRGAGRCSHAARVSRDLGICALVGAHKATKSLENGQLVTVSCCEGETGYVFEGRLPFELKQDSVQDLPRPRTRVMMDIANWREAFASAAIPNDGVGLVRLEMIITNDIRVHPLALLDYDKLDNVSLKAEIQQITPGYSDKGQFFIDKLAQGVAMIAAAFYPKDVIVRLSDFKTNEYALLVGGRKYEPTERNPMIGFRGASRYYNPRYQAGFALECRALRKVRDEMGLKNVKVMVPFCRTLEDACRVQSEMEKHGLKRGKDGLEIYLLCEVPSNIMLAQDFSDLFDGFSIGANDLTQLVLGVDQDSETVASFYDERDLAVKKTIAHVVQAARAKNRKIGVTGQAATEYPEFTRFLIEQGIDSISLKPETVLKTTMAILEQEKAMAK